MRRRTLVHAAAAFVVPAPQQVAAQAPKAGRMRRIGVLVPGSDGEPGPPGHRRPFAEKLWGSVGWVEGESLGIERRFADGNLDRLPELAGELLKQDPEVLNAYGEAALSAARASRTVPIVAMFTVDPVRQGLTDSLAKPSRNVTGISALQGLDSFDKRLQILRSLAPLARRASFIGVDQRLLTVSGEPLYVTNDIRAAAVSLGFEVSLHYTVRRPEDVQRALDQVAASDAEVVLVSGTPCAVVGDRVATFAINHRWLTATLQLDLLDAGLLVYHGTPPAELGGMYTRMAQMTDRILRGAKPGEIPMELPTRYEMALNLRTARALGLKVPPSVRLQADRVVE